MINRQKLIEELVKWGYSLDENKFMDYNAYRATRLTLDAVRNIINRQPPADQWIPCKSIQEIKDEIQAFKRAIAMGENEDYIKGYLSAMSTVEGMLADLPEPYKGVE